MSNFTKPEYGNTKRSPGNRVNSVRNLQRWLNRQARDAKAAADQ